MIREHRIKSNARSRRDASRKAKQQAWAAANPLLVGRKYQNVGETVEVEQKPGYEPQFLKFIAMDAFWMAREYKGQIMRASYLYEYEFGSLREKAVRQHQKVTNEAGRQIHAVQRVRGKSIPLV
jgi:hypothetical protein